MNLFETEIAAIAHRITLYLDAHPHAADTPEGILKWWLAGKGTLPLAQIERALAVLEDEGVLTWHFSNAGVRIYQRADSDRQ